MSQTLLSAAVVIGALRDKMLLFGLGQPNIDSLVSSLCKLYLLLACWVKFCTLLCCLKLTFSKNSFRNAISVANSWDPDGPDILSVNP